MFQSWEEAWFLSECLTLWDILSLYEEWHYEYRLGASMIMKVWDGEETVHVYWGTYGAIKV